MKRKTSKVSNSDRVYLKTGDLIGNSGYTDLLVVNNGKKYVLHSTEGGELDYYDEKTDSHHAVMFDMDGTSKTNKNFGRMYYYKFK